MKVAIFLGSKSDLDVMRGCANVLKEFNVKYEAHILSAHRVPEKLEETIRNLELNGCKVIIAGAGLAAHLPGVIASKTIIPVIGIPINASSLQGLDSLYSIVQMPKAIPVATVGINNSYNAGLLAVQMLSIADNKLYEKLKEYRLNMKENFINENCGGVDL
ncbi:MAG: 5-(carboxyamino)imidazole ribonucleotide mutase [Sarcina sp.]